MTFDLLNNIPNVEVSDTTGDDSCTIVHPIIIIHLKTEMFYISINDLLYEKFEQ
jgi:hypothetical protein